MHVGLVAALHRLHASGEDWAGAGRPGPAIVALGVGGRGGQQDSGGGRERWIDAHLDSPC